MLDRFIDVFASAQGWLFQAAVEPLLYHLGLGEYAEAAFEGTEWFLIGICELAFLWAVLRPMEALIPVHGITDRRARWNDFIYTAIHRLGAFSVIVFFVLDPIGDRIAGFLHLEGFRPFNLDDLWPGVTDQPLITFLVYLVVLDFFDYWYHRAEHHVGWWWGLHGLHHSQQNMNLWSDNRNHLIDDLLRDIYMAAIALFIGVPPSQFVLLVVVGRMLQSLQHANVRVHFGALGERLLVSPRYHRLHHAIGIGHESQGAGTRGGHNFAVLFPVWDILFGTALFTRAFARTGIRDQLPSPEGVARDYGRGFWEQQRLGVRRAIAFFRNGTA